MLKPIFILILTTTLFITTGCGALIECAFIDQSVVINTEKLPFGDVGSPYRADICAEIENTPSDDSYDYIFSLDGGQLPKGLSLKTRGSRGVISGIPENPGKYKFEIEVYVPELEEEEDDESEEDGYFNEDDEDEEFTIDCRSAHDYREFFILIRATAGE